MIRRITMLCAHGAVHPRSKATVSESFNGRCLRAMSALALVVPGVIVGPAFADMVALPVAGRIGARSMTHVGEIAYALVLFSAVVFGGTMLSFVVFWARRCVDVSRLRLCGDEIRRVETGKLLIRDVEIEQLLGARDDFVEDVFSEPFRALARISQSGRSAPLRTSLGLNPSS